MNIRFVLKSFENKIFENLFGCIEEFEHDTINKKISFFIEEKKDFPIYKWLNYAMQQKTAAEKSPFKDLDELSGFLEFWEDDEIIGCIELKNIELISHCFNEEIELSIFVHKLGFAYRSMEFLDKIFDEKQNTDKIFDKYAPKNQIIIDNEWKKGSDLWEIEKIS